MTRRRLIEIDMGMEWLSDGSVSAEDVRRTEELLMEMENERAETIDVMVFTLWNTTLELEDVAEIFGVTLDSALRHAVLSQVIRCHECRLWVFTNEIHNFLCPKCKTTAMQWSLRSVVTNYDVELLRQMGIRW